MWNCTSRNWTIKYLKGKKNATYKIGWARARARSLRKRKARMCVCVCMFLWTHFIDWTSPRMVHRYRQMHILLHHLWICPMLTACAALFSFDQFFLSFFLVSVFIPALHSLIRSPKKVAAICKVSLLAALPLRRVFLTSHFYEIILTKMGKEADEKEWGGGGEEKRRSGRYA